MYDRKAFVVFRLKGRPLTADGLVIVFLATFYRIEAFFVQELFLRASAAIMIVSAGWIIRGGAAFLRLRIKSGVKPSSPPEQNF